jgi:hypothetical protein
MPIITNSSQSCVNGPRQRATSTGNSNAQWRSTSSKPAFKGGAQRCYTGVNHFLQASFHGITPGKSLKSQCCIPSLQQSGDQVTMPMFQARHGWKNTRHFGGFSPIKFIITEEDTVKLNNLFRDEFLRSENVTNPELKKKKWKRVS